MASAIIAKSKHLRTQLYSSVHTEQIENYVFTPHEILSNRFIPLFKFSSCGFQQVFRNYGKIQISFNQMSINTMYHCIKLETKTDL